jgi:rRNA maturation RNase YbeY
MKITIASSQNHLTVNPQGAEALIRFFLSQKCASPELGHPWGEVCLSLVDSATMREVNKDYFRQHINTDVIALSYTPLPGEDALLSADIIVNAELARKEGDRRAAGTYTWDATHELALYIAHACDHLLGDDDGDETGRRRMRRRELRWLKQAYSRNLHLCLCQTVNGEEAFETKEPASTHSHNPEHSA